MHRIAVIRGDGIGPEITDATQRVLEASGVSIDWEETPVGTDAIERFGTALPAASLARIRELGAVLKAPLIAERCSGGIAVEADGEIRRYPSLNNGLRRELGSYVNLRPVCGWGAISGAWSGLDIVIVREVTEDIYSGIERRVDSDAAEAVKRVTRRASRRAAEFACEYAARHRRSKITAVHKANVLHLTDGLFLESVRDVVAEHPHLAFDDRMIDATCYLLVKNPALFDVLVLPNQYGDIVSDLAAGLAGSLGLAPGVNIGGAAVMFEAAHGAAPDIAGRDLANPIGLILSGALMLDHLNESKAAERVRRGIARVLADGGALTPDLGGSGKASELTKAICEAVRNE